MGLFNIQSNKWYLLTLSEIVVADLYNNHRKKHSLPLTCFCKFKDKSDAELTSKEASESIYKQSLELSDLFSLPVEAVKNKLYSLAENSLTPVASPVA